MKPTTPVPNIMSRKDIKLIIDENIDKPEDLLFLYSKGWAKRAGIIPYVIYAGKYHLLLGEQADTKGVPRLTDFGGGCEEQEFPLECAMREFKEETRRSFHINLNNTTHIIVNKKDGHRQVILFVRLAGFGSGNQNPIDEFRATFHNGIEYPPEMNEIQAIKWIAGDNIKIIDQKKLSRSIQSLLEYLFF